MQMFNTHIKYIRYPTFPLQVHHQVTLYQGTVRRSMTEDVLKMGSTLLHLTVLV